jgi:hypothetical protein
MYIAMPNAMPMIEWQCKARVTVHIKYTDGSNPLIASGSNPNGHCKIQMQQIEHGC